MSINANQESNDKLYGLQSKLFYGNRIRGSFAEKIKVLKSGERFSFEKG